MDDGMRQCGDCIVCCVYPRIDDPELRKPGMAHCPHLTLPGSEEPNKAYYTGRSCKNCTIYEDRPRLCEAYECAWVLGAGDDGDRPDKILMLFDRSRDIGNALEAKPLRDNQESTPEGKAAIKRMSHSMNLPVIVLNFYERRVWRVEGRGV